MFIPSPVSHGTGRWGGVRRESEREEVLRALPHAHGQAPSEEHVEQVLHLVSDLEAEAFADHYVPRAAELLVHRLLDHLRRTLEEMSQTGSCGESSQRVKSVSPSEPVTIEKSWQQQKLLTMLPDKHQTHNTQYTLTSLFVANFSQAVTQSSMVSTLISSGMSVC